MNAPKKSRRPKLDANELHIGLALRNEPDLHAGKLFRLDTFSGQTLLMQPIPVGGITAPESWRPRAITDIDVTHLMMWLQTHNFVKVAANRTGRAIDVEADRNQFSAAREALDSLPSWDQQPRLDRFWIDVCGANGVDDGMNEDEIFNRLRYLHATARCFFISIVARIMRPGCKVDTMVVLEGNQGDLKSMLLRIIAFDKEAWMSDSMPHNLGNKDARAHLAGKLIVEMAEMQQIKGTDVETMKMFLSAQDDKYRPSYGRHEIVQRRQCVFVGTTNATGYLADITGNRRFWPIACNCINLALARKIMPQLYAEALVAYNNDENWWLPPEVEDAAKVEQDSRLIGDPWHDKIEGLVTDKRGLAIARSESIFWVTSTQALEHVEPEVSRWDASKQNRVARILKKLGGENMRLPRDDGHRKRAYRFISKANGANYTSQTSQPSLDKLLN